MDVRNCELTAPIIRREMALLLDRPSIREIGVDLKEVPTAKEAMQLDISWRSVTAQARFDRKELLLSLDDFRRYILKPMAATIEKLYREGISRGVAEDWAGDETD